MSESLTKLHCEIDDSTTLQIAHLVNRHLKKTFPASQPFICQKFRENLKTLRVAFQSKLAGFSLKCYVNFTFTSNSGDNIISFDMYRNEVNIFGSSEMHCSDAQNRWTRAPISIKFSKVE